MSTRPAVKRQLGVIAAAALLLLALIPALSLNTAPVARAVDPSVTNEECLDADDEPIGCQFDVDPIPMDGNVTLGEYEVAMLSRDGAANNPRFSVGEFAMAAEKGSCSPTDGVCDSIDTTFDAGAVDAPAVDTGSIAGGRQQTIPKDAAITQYDFTGDGVSDVVFAAACDNTALDELCLSVFDPTRADSTPGSGYSPWFRTGLNTDANGFGRVEMSAGLTNESRSTVVEAAYELPADGRGMLATFTTANPNNYRPGQLVRFPDPSTIVDGLCVEPDSGDPLCLTDLVDQYLPVEAVDAEAQTFTLRLGRLIDADPADGEAVVPEGWTADCDVAPDACGPPATAVALGSGLTVAWAAPGRSLRVASFTVNPARRNAFRMLDTVAVGRLAGDAATSRAPFALATADFDGLGVDEVALTWAAVAEDPACEGVADSTCTALAFFKTNNSRQVVEAGRQRLMAETGIAAATVSLDAGTLVSTDGSNVDGADLVVGYARSAFQQLAVLDVSTSLEATDVGRNTLPFAAPAAAIANSSVQVAAADLDLDGTDEVVAASTRPDSAPTAATTTVPVALSIWDVAANANMTILDSWTSNGPGSAPNMASYGAFGTGQVELQVGTVGRPPTGVVQEYPNSLNPDIVLAWPCANSCGPGGGAGVAMLPFGVEVDGTEMALENAGNLQTPIVRESRLPPATSDDPRLTQPSLAAIALADLNQDSETLGYPTTYVKVNEVRPVLVLRPPPTQLDAFDNVTAEEGINYWEVQDVNGCVMPSTCDDTFVRYTSDNTVESRISATITNDWAVGAFGSVGAGNDNTDIEGYVKGFVERTGQDSEENTAGKAFSYSSQVTLGAGSSAAYAATQSTKISEFPVFDGVSAWTPDAEPSRTVLTLNPARTEFSWIDLEDQDLGFGSSAPVPRNLLSYPSDRNSVATSFTVPTKISRYNANHITVQGAHNFTCDSSEWTNLSTGYLTEFPCASSDMARVRLVGTPYQGEYLLTRIESANQIRLAKATGTITESDADTCAARCKLLRLPGKLDEMKTVSNSLSASGSFTVSQQSEFQGSAAWSLGGGVEGYFRYGGDAAVPVIGVGWEYAPSVKVEAGLHGSYASTQQSTMAVAASVDTQFEYAVDSPAVTKVSYKVQPWLAEDPATGAMTLDWTASCANCNSTFWQQYAQRPDPGLALPDLLDPYLSPQGIPGIQGVDLLRTPSLATWQCTRGICAPPKDMTVGKPAMLTARVSNYSLKAYQSNRPVVVRWFAGDPRLGGYQIAQANAPTADRSLPGIAGECGAARFCIPAQKTVVAWTRWTPPPGLAGAGTALRQFPIYAVVDPVDRIAEVHDWETPVNLRDCADTYPYLLGPAFVQYDVPESLCPTTNNEGYYLPGFSGQNFRAADLFIAPKGIKLTANERAIKVAVGARKQAARADLRIWYCRARADCTPATAASWKAEKTLSSLGPGRNVTATIPVRLAKGDWTIWAQVVPRSNFEQPGGGRNAARGLLNDNLRRATVTVG